MKKLLILSALLIFIFNSFSQEILDNQSVIDMIEIGFEEQVIIDKIESTNTDFDTSIEALKSLKNSGVSASLLSAILKVSKKEPSINLEREKQALAPKAIDKEFYWEDGKGELVKVSFGLNIGGDYSIDESELAEFTNQIMTLAKMKLKVPSSFRPNSLLVRKRTKTDKYGTKNDKTEYVMQLGSSGTNGYGGVVDGYTIMGISPKLMILEKSEEDIVQELTAKKFTYKKVYIDGKSSRMKGEVSIQKDRLFITFNEMGTDTGPISIKDREIISDNHWKAESKSGGVKTEIEYNGNNKKYKSDGGTLTTKAMGYTMIYVLNKVTE